MIVLSPFVFSELRPLSGIWILVVDVLIDWPSSVPASSLSIITATPPSVIAMVSPTEITLAPILVRSSSADVMASQTIWLFWNQCGQKMNMNIGNMDNCIIDILSRTTTTGALINGGLGTCGGHMCKLHHKHTHLLMIHSPIIQK